MKNSIYNVKLNSFYQLVEQLCQTAGVKNTNHWHSKKMYGNIKLTYLICKMQQLQTSYRRFIEIISEDGTQHMLCLKKIPHFTTLQKFVKRTPKTLFEKLVKACRKILNLKNIESSIDSTGFSNTNPSHHYCKRIHKEVKNYTKTTFLTDNKTKIILNVKTVSDRTHDSTFFKPMIKELASSLKLVLADKGYDSQENRKYCLKNNIEVHIPFRHWSKTRKQEFNIPSKRMLSEKKFDQTKYNKRSTIEAINSAVKQTLGGFVRARNASQQQKAVTLKALTYNIERMERTIKIVISITIQ
jgi:transposase